MIPIANRPTAIDSTINTVPRLIAEQIMDDFVPAGPKHDAFLSLRHAPSGQRLPADNFTISQSDDPRASFGDIFIMRDQKDRPTLPDQICEQIDDGCCRSRVQAAGRFISHQDRRIICHGTGDRQTLLLPSRKGCRILPGMVGNIHLFQQHAWRAGVVPARNIAARSPWAASRFEAPSG